MQSRVMQWKQNEQIAFEITGINLALKYIGTTCLVHSFKLNQGLHPAREKKRVSFPLNLRNEVKCLTGTRLAFELNLKALRVRFAEPCS